MGNRDHKTALYDQFARVGKALASGKRLELLDLLAQGERDVASLAAAADLGLTTASAHLQTLRQANLVTTRRDGTRILFNRVVEGSLSEPLMAAAFVALSFTGILWPGNSQAQAIAQYTMIQSCRCRYIGKLTSGGYIISK